MEDENMPAAQPGALTADAVADAVYRAVRRCATHLRPDVLAAMQAAHADETQPRAQSVLDCLLENARIGQEDGVPICQDTGTCWVRLEVGEELLIPGNILSGVNDAVARAYTDGRLRMSVVADALLDRTNTGDNTPAFAEIALRPGRGATLHVLLKGGGSDNASRVVMLAPGAGWEGVKKVVLDCVREKAANACPPLIVGVGVGATFDKVAGRRARWEPPPQARRPPSARPSCFPPSTPRASGRRPSAAARPPWPCTWKPRRATSPRCLWR
nr:fumarate hydratase [uncultured Senegalimassilia sp.]